MRRDMSVLTTILNMEVSVDYSSVYRFIYNAYIIVSVV